MKNIISSFKKLIVIAVLAITCIVPISSGSVIKASAATNPSLIIKTSRVVTSPKSGVYSGDVKIEIKLSRAVTVAGMGFTVTVGNGLNFRKNGTTVICDNSFSCAQDSINFKSQVFVGSNPNGVSNTTLLTVYAYKSSSLNSSNGTVSVAANLLSGVDGSNINLSNVTVGNTSSTTSINPSTGYVLGDANGDGSVDSKDSVYLHNVLKDKGISSISVYTVANNLSSYFPKAKAAEAVDANVDKAINKNDSDTILNYYAATLANSYSGNVGKYFYTVKVV